MEERLDSHQKFYWKIQHSVVNTQSVKFFDQWIMCRQALWPSLHPDAHHAPYYSLSPSRQIIHRLSNKKINLKVLSNLFSTLRNFDASIKGDSLRYGIIRLTYVTGL